jgi:hypothetical protein
LLGIAAVGGIAINRGEVRDGILLILLTYIMMVPLYVNARLLASRVCVNDDAITLSVFGARWKTIMWRSAKRIRRFKSYDIFVGRVVITYCIDQDQDHTFYLLPKGPIVFDETIKEFDKLLSLVNNYAVDYQINLVSITGKHADPLERL